MRELKLLVCDDHALLRLGLRKILEERPEWRVVAEAGDGRAALHRVLELAPDIVILDIGMPMLNGIEVTKQILRRRPNVAILILSMHADEAYVTQAMRAGAKGYLLKDSAGTDLIQAVSAIASGKSFFSPAIASMMADDHVQHLADKGVDDRCDLLSEREREILQLVAVGHSSKAVAEQLSISPATVETHRAHILQKLDLHSTAELVLFAVRRRLIS